jgi:hypothetical protein
MKKKTFLDSIRIYLTESCNANCVHCFNKNIRTEEHMPYEQVKKIFKYLHDNDIKKLKVMGGEPTVHPKFTDIYLLSQSLFNEVALFTNALNDEILRIKPRERDAIIYNFVFINKTFDFKKLLLAGNNFPRIFEIVIDSTTDIELLSEKINFVYRECEKRNIHHIYFQLTINCIDNIFDSKKIFNTNFRMILSFLIKFYPKHLSFDHTVPLCFWENETIELMCNNKIDYYKKTCRGIDFGLVDSKFNLLHCNQYPVILSPILENDRFISIKKMEELLKKSNDDKKKLNYNQLCI